MTRARVRDLKSAWKLGNIHAIEYHAVDDGKRYRHSFKKSNRPALASSSDGKQMVIVGGRYRVTDRGIED